VQSASTRLEQLALSSSRMTQRSVASSGS